MALETKETDFRSDCDAKCSEFQSEISEPKVKNILGDNDEEDLYDRIDVSLCDSIERLNSAKRELALKLRETVSLKRQLDDAPTPAELVQYEHRSSELNAHIQEKHRQTRKYYATYNALLEIRDLMLKETSLLNSIDRQFQDAVASPAGRLKLIDSMEGILKGTEQKLDKVLVALQTEQKACEDVKARYAAAITDQRSCYSLLKAFQEECAKNERLRKQN